MTDALHVFEKSGCGRAPFRCVAMFSIPSPSLAERNPDAYNAALRELPRDLHCGTCNHCGTAIMHNFVIEDHVGKRFVVGSSCVYKTGDAGLIKQVRATRLAAVREVRAAKKRMKADERAAVWAAERAQRRADFLVQYATLIEKAQPYMHAGTFIGDVMERHLAGGFVSEKALAAVERTIDENERMHFLRINSKHVGVVGKRDTFKVTVERRASYTRPAFNGFGNETVWIITMRDEAGNALVSKSSSFSAEKGEQLTIKATVKEHGDYKGEKQTVVQRVKELVTSAG